MPEKLILFIDGHCLFCNKFAIFCLKNEVSSKYNFYFSAQNSEFANYLLSKYNYTLNNNTVICLKSEKILTKCDVLIEIARGLKFPFNFIAVIKIFPKWLNNFFYDLFAKNRYLFGKKKESCEMIPLQFKNRFI